MSELASEPSTRRVVAAYLWSDRALSSGLRMLRGIFDGFWLGVLDRDQLAAIDENYYDGASEYHTEAHNRSGLFDWEQTAISRHFACVHAIIVTSAGGGREVLALAKLGYQVVGFEPHAELARFGNQLLAADGGAATIRPCARDAWPADSGRADAVVVGWSGYALTAGRSSRVELLRGAARSLPVGAPILVSFYAIRRADVRLRMAARVAAPLRRARRREPVAVGDALVPNLMHFFTRDELAREFSDGGFDLVDFDTQDYGWAVGRVRPRPGEDNR